MYNFVMAYIQACVRKKAVTAAREKVSVSGNVKEEVVHFAALK